MTQQILCDECGQPVDVTVPHYQLSGSKVQVNADGGLVAVEAAVTLHYHEEHLPIYKIAGEPVNPPPDIDPDPDAPHVDNTLPEPEPEPEPEPPGDGRDE